MCVFLNLIFSLFFEWNSTNAWPVDLEYDLIALISSRGPFKSFVRSRKRSIQSRAVCTQGIRTQCVDASAVVAEITRFAGIALLV